MVNNSQLTIDRSLKTARLIDAFWDRWIVHGLDREEIESVRSTLPSIDQWINVWSSLAEEKLKKALSLNDIGEISEAAEKYQNASLYFNLAQWIFPDPVEEKLNLYERCLTSMHEADKLHPIKTQYVTMTVDDRLCFGRVRIPKDAVGCIIIFNPIDSTKEELFMYEQDFVDKGFMTVSFDGPGQGEAFIRQGFKGTLARLYSFANGVIDYARSITDLPIYLFGTSSGASWAVYGSCHPEVSKVVAVSPTDRRDKLFVPAYFNGRLASILDEFELVPDYDLTFQNPLLIYHGNLDSMVSFTFVNELFCKLPSGRRLIQFEGEGHCCNYKLAEIRDESVKWFMENSHDD